MYCVIWQCLILPRLNPTNIVFQEFLYMYCPKFKSFYVHTICTCSTTKTTPPAPITVSFRETTAAATLQSHGQHWGTSYVQKNKNKGAPAAPNDKQLIAVVFGPVALVQATPSQAARTELLMEVHLPHQLGVLPRQPTVSR